MSTHQETVENLAVAEKEILGLNDRINTLEVELEGEKVTYDSMVQYTESAKADLRARIAKQAKQNAKLAEDFEHLRLSALDYRDQASTRAARITELEGQLADEKLVAESITECLRGDRELITTLRADRDTLTALVERAIGLFETIHSSDGSGHADLGRSLQRALDQAKEGE